jgi:AraC-like DNA-binding protein
LKPFHAFIDYPVGNSFIIKYDNFPHFSVPLHFHNEYEIVYIIKSTGKKYVGDVVESFESGDLSFYGNNLHHFYLNDEKYYNNDPEFYVNAIVVLFPSDYFSARQLHQPEFTLIRKLLNNTTRGLKFPAKTVSDASNLLQKMLITSGIERYLLFLRFLNLLGSSDYQSIASFGYTNKSESFGEHRMEKIYKFCKHNFTRKLTLKEVSSIAAMNPTAFCRYFRNNTGKTFVRFINELRVSFSCNMLKQSNQKIDFISGKSGFSNLSNYNRIFKEIVGKSPSEYRNLYKGD